MVCAICYGCLPQRTDVKIVVSKCINGLPLRRDDDDDRSCQYSFKGSFPGTRGSSISAARLGQGEDMHRTHT